MAEGSVRKKMADDLGMKAHNKFMSILEHVPTKALKNVICKVIAGHMVTNNKTQDLIDVAAAMPSKAEERALIIKHLAFGAARLNAYLTYVCNHEYAPYVGNGTTKAPHIDWGADQLCRRVYGPGAGGTPRGVAAAAPAGMTAAVAAASPRTRAPKAKAQTTPPKAAAVAAGAKRNPAKAKAKGGGAAAPATPPKAAAKPTQAPKSKSQTPRPPPWAKPTAWAPRQARDLSPPDPVRNVAPRREQRDEQGAQRGLQGQRPTQRDGQGRESSRDAARRERDRRGRDPSHDRGDRDRSRRDDRRARR